MFAAGEVIVAARNFPHWPRRCRGCARCRHWRKPCELRDLGALVQMLEETDTADKVRALRATRLTHGLTLANTQRLLHLLPSLEILDLTKSRALSTDIVDLLLAQPGLRLVCLIQAENIDALAAHYNNNNNKDCNWTKRVVWLGVYDFEKWSDSMPHAAAACSKNHHEWPAICLSLHLQL